MATEPTPCAPVAFDDLQSAYDFVDMGRGESQAYLDPRTGRIFYVSDLVDTEDEDIPEDLDTSDIYIPIPDKRELGLGLVVVEAFVDSELPDDWKKVLEIFRRKGAYGRFKQLLQDRGALERWYAFEAAAAAEALRNWCEANEIPLKAADPAGCGAT
jgi:hypothetical protein